MFARLLLALTLVLSQNSYAVVMMGGDGLADLMSFMGQAQAGTDPAFSDLNIRLFVDCFPTTFQNVPNPMSHDATIKFAIGLGNPKEEIGVVFPAWLATNILDPETISLLLVMGTTADPLTPNPIVKEASGTHGLIRIRLGQIPGLAVIDAQGNYPAQTQSAA